MARGGSSYARRQAREGGMSAAAFGATFSSGAREPAVLVAPVVDACTRLDCDEPAEEGSELCRKCHDAAGERDNEREMGL